MRVREFMSAPTATVAPGASLNVAYRTMSRTGVRHLPVVNGRAFVGVISQRDVLRSLGLLLPIGFGVATGVVLKLLRVGDVMSSTAITIGADASIPEAAELLLKRCVGYLPVLERGTLVGTVTTTDVLRALARPSGEMDARSATAMTGTARVAPGLVESGA